MFILTQQERRVILFLLTVAIAGMGINLCIKVNSRAERIIRPDSNIGKLDINNISREALLRSRLISNKLAERIIEYRDINGPFLSLDDLKEVKGIGDFKLQKLKEIFFVE